MRQYTSSWSDDVIPNDNHSLHLLQTIALAIVARPGPRRDDTAVTDPPNLIEQVVWFSRHNLCLLRDLTLKWE
jgi:hypothetical protein